MSIKIGDQAPEFTLKDSLNNNVSLSDFQGKKKIVYFYPKDNTPGCTKEACNFRENWEILKKNNFVILGISKDSPSSHTKFKEKYNLPFILLTDPLPCEIASSYDSYGLKKFMGKEYMGMIRNTFLIDEEGKIAKIYKGVKAAMMADFIISDLKIT